MFHPTTVLHPASESGCGGHLPAASSCNGTRAKALLSQLPCTQVVAFANALRGPDGAPLVRAAHVATNSPPPRDVPDLVTATPAGLITATQNYGPFFGWEWTRAGIMARCGAPRLGDKTLRGAVPCLPAWR